MAVEAVVGKIDLPSHEPFGPGMIPFQHVVPLLEPVQFAGDGAPELFRLFHRLAVDVLVFFQAFYVRLLPKILWTLEFSLLVQNRLDVASYFGRRGLLCHGESSLLF